MCFDKTILAAVFDLGGVVVEVREERPARHWAASAGACERDVAWMYRDDTHYHLLECGKISMADYHEHIVARIGRPLSFEQFVAGWNTVIGDLMPGAEALLAALADQVRLIVLSNTNACHKNVWHPRLTGALKYFERVFLSHEMLVRKPEPASFKVVLDYLGLPAARVAFIDDNAENVAAARASGMKAILARGTESISSGLAELGLVVGAPRKADAG